MWNARNGTVGLDGTEVDYVVFGQGDKPLVMLPGVGDGLRTVKGMALPLSAAFKKLGKTRKVYIFSRKRQIPESYSTQEMARDQAEVMRSLGLLKADVLGVSQGGMIAQYMAIDHPDVVGKLVAVVTTARKNETMQGVISRWIELAMAGDFREIIIDTAEKSYSEQALKRYRRIYPLMTAMSKPKEPSRFLTQAQSCLTHNCFDRLSEIGSPTLVIGGRCDKIVEAQASVELAEQIKNSRLHMYEGLGHAAYEEAEDFCARVLDFLDNDN